MARIDTLSNFLNDIASAIRNKKGTLEEILARDFDVEIASIETGTEDYFTSAVYLSLAVSGGEFINILDITPQDLEDSLLYISKITEGGELI